MTSLAYLDTSAFLKLFLEESRSAEVAAVCQAPDAAGLATPLTS